MADGLGAGPEFAGRSSLVLNALGDRTARQRVVRGMTRRLAAREGRAHARDLAAELFIPQDARLQKSRNRASGVAAPLRYSRCAPDPTSPHSFPRRGRRLQVRSWGRVPQSVTVFTIHIRSGGPDDRAAVSGQRSVCPPTSMLWNHSVAGHADVGEGFRTLPRRGGSRAGDQLAPSSAVRATPSGPGSTG